ncbi:MAG: hypothetical protein QME06_10340 [Desulfobacterales bacterium]|nr:hypothetical protein [Desulfobacterales bacterium]
MERHPFNIDAFVLLPDHSHCIWTLPQGDSDFSMRWRYLIQHVEYIHYNPVKHGLAKAPTNWEYSSFHRYVRDGVYNSEWGAGVKMKFDSEVGGE